MTNRRTPSSPAPSEPSRDQARAAILEAAKGLSQRYGLQKTTMENIAHAMGKQKSFLYYYFSSKQDLVDALLEGVLEEIRQAVRSEVERQNDALGKLKAYFSSRLRHVAAKLDLYQLTLLEIRGGTSGSATFLQVTAQHSAFDVVDERYLASIIREGIREGSFRALSKDAVTVYSHFIMAAILGAELKMMLDPTKAAQIQREVEASCDLVLHGLTT